MPGALMKASQMITFTIVFLLIFVIVITEPFPPIKREIYRVNEKVVWDVSLDVWVKVSYLFMGNSTF